MILWAFRRAVGQLGDRRFRRVLGLALALTLALLFAVYALFLSLAGDPTDLPYIGRIDSVWDVFGGRSLLYLLIASIFLMTPVAMAFTGLFLPDVAAAVEALHYAFLPAPIDPRPAGLGIATANQLGLMLLLNVLATGLALQMNALAYLLIFPALNGALLGRACFLFTALRRLPRAKALAMRRRNWRVIWGAGTLMALLVCVPLVNLLAPVVGVAAFTHLFHRLAADGR